MKSFEKYESITELKSKQDACKLSIQVIKIFANTEFSDYFHNMFTSIAFIKVCVKRHNSWCL